LKTKTIILNERDHHIVMNVLQEKLNLLKNNAASIDAIADIKYVISYINSILWKE